MGHGSFVRLAAALLLSLVAGMAATASGAAPTPVGGPFSLVDTNGHAVTDETYRGRVMLIYFGYTFCPDVCPTTLNKMASALGRLTKQERIGVVPLFITIDPDRDTPSLLRNYLTNFGQDFIGLTGTRSQIARVEDEFHVYARKVAIDGSTYGIDHSSEVYVTDREGHLRAVMPDDASLDEMTATLRQIAAQAADPRGK